MTFPTTRPRRLRHTPALRRMVRETTLDPSDFIYPLFVQHGEDQRIPIGSMPGQFRLSVDQLAAEAAELVVLHYDHDFDLIADITHQPTEWIVPAGTVS